MPPKEKILTPSDLDPIRSLHSDLKKTFQEGMSNLQKEMKEANLIQNSLAKDVEHIKVTQDKYEDELRVVRETQLKCPAATSFVGTMKRIAKLERFKDKTLESGIFKDSGFPITSPKLLVKAIRVALTLLFGAALGGALLSLAFFFA